VARQTSKILPGLLAGAFSMSVEKAKTAGPANALADNADADNGEGRFHRRFIALRHAAVKSGGTAAGTPFAWRFRNSVQKIGIY
jgi:hypothetical protein